jgi:outer membrane protein TolC
MSLFSRKPLVLMATRTRVAARSLTAMAEPAGRARGSCRTPPVYHPWIALSQACLIIAMLILAGGAILWYRPAQGADLSPEVETPIPNSPLSFDDSVKIAIHQSPYFTKTSQEISIRRMDESDSRYGMVPPLTFTTYYYVNQPSGINTKPYSLNFSTDPYNPFGSYFLLQAQKLVSQIAIFNHLKVISQGLESLGGIYLELDALKKMAALQRDLISLSQENLNYRQNQLSIGTGTSLDVKLAQQELLLAKGEQEGLALAQKRNLASLKAMLGLPANQEITLDLRDSRRQVLGNFNPATATVEQAKSRDYGLKVIEYQRKIQKYNVSLAVAKVFPDIVFNAQSPNPLSVTTSTGLYVGFGLNIPVWDGFKRIRNVSRQKAVLRQVASQKETRQNSLENKWLGDVGLIQEKDVDRKLAKSREELARLKAHQNEVRYQSGQVPLPALLESRKEVLAAEKNTVRKNQEYDMAVLKLREISGDLGYSYVDASSWQK